MGRKGKTHRLKRLPAPRFWSIHRKEYLWVVKPSPGSHSLEKSLPLALVLRDMLEVAKTRKEAKMAVAQGKIFVDGLVELKDDFPIGLMDVVSMPELDKYYRIMPSHKGLFLNPIAKDEANFKLCRVEDKAKVKGGHIQISLHDGSNLLIKVADPKKPQEDIYNTFDTLKLSVPDKEIIGCVPLKEGNFAVITGGKNIGKQGKIVDIEKAEAKKRRSSLIIIEDAQGNRYQTILDFVFSLGEAQPLVSVPEVA